MESMRPNNTPAGSRSSPAPGTEGGSSADLSSSLSQSTEDVSQDMVCNWIQGQIQIKSECTVFI